MIYHTKILLHTPFPKSYPVINFDTNTRPYIASISSIKEPTSSHEAIQDNKLKDAMMKEIKALELNNTWE